MDKHEQNMAIAKVCGTLKNPAPGLYQYPRYTEDLNAMHEAEKMLGDGYKRCQYIDNLCWCCRRDGMDVRYLEAPFASAAQRAESFLYVFGLLEDSESQRKAAESSDEMPDGQAENA